MKKNGFSFIETVVTVVILSASLLLVYNSYSSVINNEQQRIYYNDPAYIYRTASVLEFLNYNSIIMSTINEVFGSSNKYVQQIGVNYSNMYKSDEQKNDIEQLINTYDINQMFVIKKDLLDVCSLAENDYQGLNCLEAYSEIVDCSDPNNINQTQCKCRCRDALMDLNSATKFVRTINSTEDDYYLVVEYAEMSKNVGIDMGRLTKCYLASEQKYGCHYYYASIPIKGVYLS